MECGKNCYNNFSRKYSHFLLYPNHTCVLEDIIGLHILEDKNKNVDQKTQGEEVHTQSITLSSQKYEFYSYEKGNIKRESFDCETIPSMELTSSQSQLVINMLAEKWIPSRETTIEDISLLRETFHSTTSYTFPSLYPYLF
jgi:hypothetical protein